MVDRTYQINVKELAKELDSFSELVSDRAKTFQANLTTAVLKSLLVATPVDTGELRAGWVASVGTPSDFVPEPRERTKGDRKGIHGAEGRANVADASGRLKGELQAARLGTRSFIVNNVRYVNYVNDKGDHAGFIEAAVDNAQSRFE